MNRSSMENHFAPVPVSRGVLIADISLLVIGFLAGTFGNGRAWLLLRRRRDLRKTPHFLFANLSVIGFVSSLVSIFGWLVLIVISHVLYLNVPSVLCYIIIPFVTACIILNAMTLSLMAIDRQDCVLRPFHRRITPRNVKTVILTTWLVTLVFTSVFAFSEAFTSDSICRNFDPYSLLGKLTSNNIFVIYFVTVSMFLNTTTFLIIVVTFIRIIIKLRSSPVLHSESVHNRRERRITKLTFRSCAMFVICFLPGFICNFLVRFGGFNDAEINAARVLTVTIAKFTYVLNPFLHHKMLKVQRTANNIFPMVAAHQDLGTLAGVSHLAYSAGVHLHAVAGAGVSVTQITTTETNLATVCKEPHTSHSDSLSRQEHKL